MKTLTHPPVGLAQTLALALALWLSATLAQAEPSAEQRQEMEAAQKAAQAAEVRGPADVPMGDQAVLKLPAGMGYIPQPAAGRFMRAMGNSSDEHMLGLIESLGEDPWLVVARWEPSGFIKDDDARDWDINALHQSLKEGTEASNSERRERGFPELEVLDWVERPHYDAASHRLVWSLAAQTKGSPQGQAHTVNYNTYALGREGYISLNLITGSDRIGQDKHAATTLLAALQYQPGKSYAEFNASTDHVAEYGLAALVAGVAAKKLGMFALAAAFLAKFAKVGALAALGLGAGLRKYFKKKNSDTAGTS